MVQIWALKKFVDFFVVCFCILNIILKHSKTILFLVWLKESYEPGLRPHYSTSSLEQIFLKSLGEGVGGKGGKWRKEGGKP